MQIKNYSKIFFTIKSRHAILAFVGADGTDEIQGNHTMASMPVSKTAHAGSNPASPANLKKLTNICL